LTESVEPVEEPLEELCEEELEGSCVELLRLAVAAAPALLPGNALAATSASTAVRATLPAIIQRLARESRSIAASRSMSLWWMVM
jgi:hypothetical protein